MDKIQAVGQLWEQQIGEPIEKFRMFATYRDMIPRNKAKIAKWTGRTRQDIQKYSITFKWASRAAAWDKELDRRIREMQTEEIADMRKRHIDGAIKMQEIAAMEVNARLEKIKAAVEAAQADGRKYHDPTISIRDLVSLVEFATKSERLNRGEPTDKTQIEALHVTAVIDKQLSNLEVEELRQLRDLQYKAVTGSPPPLDVTPEAEPYKKLTRESETIIRRKAKEAEIAKKVEAVKGQLALQEAKTT